MPYDAAGKAAAKEYVAEIRRRTACERCGAQPVEWHHPDGQPVAHYNHSVSKLAARGHTIERIQQEIDACEALCRSCHMAEDGRTAALVAARPRKKGDVIVPPKPCVRCGRVYKPLRKSLCGPCYDRERRNA